MKITKDQSEAEANTAEMFLMCVCPLIDGTNCTGENQVATINIISLSWIPATTCEVERLFSCV